MPEHTPAPTPARSLYGFFMFLLFKTIFGIYCIWAFVPIEYLHYLNIYYFPLKYWVTAIPIQFLVALTLFAFIIYPSSNLMLTADIDNPKTIHDIHSKNVSSPYNNLYGSEPLKCVCQDKSKCSRQFYIAPPNDINENTVLPLKDLNISEVCKNMYSSGRKSK